MVYTYTAKPLHVQTGSSLQIDLSLVTKEKKSMEQLGLTTIVKSKDDDTNFADLLVKYTLVLGNEAKTQMDD